MVESVGLCCTKCNHITNIDSDESRNYNRSNPFICQTCLQSKPKEEPISSRSQESERYNNPDLIEQVTNTKNVSHLPENKKDPQIHIKIPKLETLEDYEQAAVGKVKERLEEFRHAREQAQRDLQNEQVRVDREERNFGHHNIIGITCAFIGVAILLVIGIQILGVVGTQSSNIDCTKLPGNAGTHQTITNATGWAKQCLNTNQQVSNAYTLLEVILIVISAVTILFVIRML